MKKKRDGRQRKPAIDRDKLRAKLRKTDDAEIYGILDRPIALLPTTKLRKLIEPCFRLEDLAVDRVAPDDLLGDVKDFARSV